MTMPLMKPQAQEPGAAHAADEPAAVGARPRRARHDRGRRRRPLRAAGVPATAGSAVPAARRLPPLPLAAAASGRRRAAPASCSARPCCTTATTRSSASGCRGGSAWCSSTPGRRVIVHLHGDVPSPRRPRSRCASTSARASTAPAQAVLIGFPPEESEHMADDKMLREMTSDPKFRKVLVTDGKTAVGQALVEALVKAGAEIVWVGHAEPWKKLPGLDDITALPQVTLVPLDLTNGRSVARARRRDRRQGRHRRQQRRGAPRLRHRRAARHRRRQGRDGHQLLRPAAPGAGVRPGAEGRARPTARRTPPPGSTCCRSTRCPTSRRTAPSRPRRRRRIRSRSACAPRCGRPASA